MLSDAARNQIIHIACQSLHAALTNEKYAPPEPQNSELHCHCGCFVTYKTDEQLRGCLGCFTANTPLYLTIANYARFSAQDDPRFNNNRLSLDELKDVHIDISVLSPVKPCSDPENIVLGRDGILIQCGMRSGCFLPQVATETGWSVEEFWGNCCSHKAGLPYEAWRQPDIDLYTFTAEIIESPYVEPAST